MKQKLLLLGDVDDLGRSGEVVETKPGYARNYLLPKALAIAADRNTLRMQERLRQERAKKAEIDRKDSDDLALKIKDKLFTTEVKVDQDGHLYGSVSANDIAEILQKEGFPIQKKNIPLAKPIKKLGEFPLILKLKEGVTVEIKFKVMSEGGLIESERAKEAALQAAKAPEGPEEESNS